MKKSTIFKAFAVTNFIALFSSFLLYRNGSFDSYIYNNSNNFTSPNGGVGAKQIADSIKRRIDSIHKFQKIRFASSKSIVAIDRSPRIDSTRVQPTEKEKEMMQKSKPEMMFSSKSGMIIEPNMFTLDSILKESKLKEKEKQKKQQ